MSKAKVEIDLVSEVLKNNELEEDLVMKITRELHRELEQKLADEESEKEPAVKKQFVVVVHDPDGVLAKTDLVATVVQIPENDSPGTTLDRVHSAAAAYNATRKGRAHPAKSVAEAFEVVGGKQAKSVGLWIKTKLPVSAIRTDGQLREIRQE